MMESETSFHRLYPTIWTHSWWRRNCCLRGCGCGCCCCGGSVNSFPPWWSDKRGSSLIYWPIHQKNTQTNNCYPCETQQQERKAWVWASCLSKIIILLIVLFSDQTWWLTASQIPLKGPRPNDNIWPDIFDFMTLWHDRKVLAVAAYHPQLL